MRAGVYAGDMPNVHRDDSGIISLGEAMNAARGQFIDTTAFDQHSGKQVLDLFPRDSLGSARYFLCR